MNKSSIIMLAVFGFSAVVLNLFMDRNTNKMLPTTDYTVAGYEQSDIVIFTADWCGACKTVKSKLNSENIEYIELDIETDDAIYDEYKRLGGEYIPLIIYQGKIINSRPGRLLSELGYTS